QAGSSATVVLEWEESPVYVREGSVVVKGDVYQGNNKWTGTDGESWSPSLTIEVYPTYKAGYAEASFPYYTGKDSEVVGINVVADEKAKTVTVQWSGDLGVPGTPQVVVYGKSGARNGTVTAPVSGKGGKVIVEGFESIFG
ncbi:hypothetical protein LTR40_013890, partial [Exophiala xenobiotica]